MFHLPFNEDEKEDSIERSEKSLSMIPSFFLFERRKGSSNRLWFFSVSLSVMGPESEPAASAASVSCLSEDDDELYPILYYHEYWPSKVKNTYYIPDSTYNGILLITKVPIDERHSTKIPVGIGICLFRNFRTTQNSPHSDKNSFRASALPSTGKIPDDCLSIQLLRILRNCHAGS